MIKRFFTKKSVAFLTVVILMAIVLPFHSAHAESFFTSWIGKAIGTVTEFSANSVVGIVKALIEYVLIPIASVWIAITGTILDYSIQFTIYGDGITTLKESLNNVWVLLRDVFNISFIFLLL